ncbi:recombining binding protein suppressor of hairless-like protein isoform X2 [Phyllopteryx taeniolatus]|uniref:recombining binding protein suppressor of hairless-like protein isoform X2 n=1 Tax=Phyllopteryx taeniolatus TaxID=161469 RepID=UPI002AD2ECD7|nr:recombining binding protein suppressor of hairless-like protein isoform X2 [Phyllopteryx taeniolatus]
MDIAAMMDELTDAMEDGQREVSLHHSACYQNEPVTHLLDGGHAAWDRRAEPACQSLAPRGGALGDQSVVILHAKVAQKSYGNEKRFFCPPPCVYIGGNIWRLMHDLLQASVCGGGGAVRGYMCVDSAALTHSDAYKLNFETLPDTAGMLACAKSLFISDQDKRKHFRLLLRLFLEVGSSRQEVGSFHSRPIKVISKPSQKRQTMKNADLCISASSRVALFNRLRSQTVSTRYLAVEGGAFVASARQWTAFAITLLEDHRAEHQGDFVLSEGFVCYGSVVQLVCTETGLALPPMVIRKVNKQHVVSCVDEPVSQLHKCALEMRESPRAFLAVANDAVVLHREANLEQASPLAGGVQRAGGRPSAPERRLVLDRHRRGGGGIRLLPGRRRQRPHARHAVSRRRRPGTERRRARGHLGAPRRQLRASPQSLLRRQRGRHHVQVRKVPRMRGS